MEPIRVPLSVHQVARLAAFAADEQALANRRNGEVSMLIASVVDPTSLVGWAIRVDADAIVCTPPPEPEK